MGEMQLLPLGPMMFAVVGETISAVAEFPLEKK